MTDDCGVFYRHYSYPNTHNSSAVTRYMHAGECTLYTNEQYTAFSFWLGVSGDPYADR